MPHTHIILPLLSRALLAACIVLSVTGLGCAPTDQPSSGGPTAHRGREEPPLPAPDRMPPGAVAAPFTLTERSGMVFDSTSLRG